MKVITYTRPDGGLSIVHPAPNARRSDETEDAFLARVAAKDVPKDATGVTIIDAADVPADRTFREAWALAEKRVAVDMPKARTIHMGRIRAARDAALAKLDVDYQRADEGGDAATKRSVAERKQALRDVPQTFDLSMAETPEALAALWPEGLDRR